MDEDKFKRGTRGWDGTSEGWGGMVSREMWRRWWNDRAGKVHLGIVLGALLAMLGMYFVR
jgi:hypothetical protein